MRGAASADRWVQSFPIYYGWVVAAVGTLGFIFSSPGQTYVVSILLDPLLAEFSMSRTAFSTLYMVATLTGSLMLPWVGTMVDKHGCRAVLTLVTLALAGVLVLGSAAKQVWQLALLLVGLRFLAQGSMVLVSATMINQWWVRRRGRIMGLVGLLAAVLGTGCFPPLMHELITRFGWRGSLRWEALLVATVMLPLALLLARNRPEDHRLRPDGAVQAEGQTEPPEIEGVPLAEARRQPIFWIACAGVSLLAMLITGLHFHAVQLFEDQGLSAATAAATYFPMAVTAALTTLISGWWADHIAASRLLAASLFALALSTMAATAIATAVPVMLYAGLLGATGGLFRTTQGVIWSQLFGRKALGAITGTASTMMVGASAFGPLPLGWARDSWGSFQPMLWGLAVLPVLLGLATIIRGEIRRARGLSL